MKRPAVFFDRDNTLIACDGYLGDPEKVVLIDGAAEAIVRVRDLGFAAVVFSNQSGVARGMFPEEAVHAVNHRMDDLLHEDDPRALIDRHDFCPYHPGAKVPRYRVDSDLRKPKPGMIYQAERVLDLDLSRSWVVGDAPRDIAAGHAAGLRTVLLKIASLPPSPATNEGAGVTPDFVASSLREAIDFIERNRELNGVHQPDVAADEEVPVAAAAAPAAAAVGLATPRAADPEDVVDRTGDTGAAGISDASGFDGAEAMTPDTDTDTDHGRVTEHERPPALVGQERPVPAADEKGNDEQPTATAADADRSEAPTAAPAGDVPVARADEPEGALGTADRPDDDAADTSGSGTPPVPPDSERSAVPVSAADAPAGSEVFEGEVVGQVTVAAEIVDSEAVDHSTAPAEAPQAGETSRDGAESPQVVETPVEAGPLTDARRTPSDSEPVTPDRAAADAVVAAPATPPLSAAPADRAEETVKPIPAARKTGMNEPVKAGPAKPVQGGFVVKPAQGSMTWGERMRLAKQGGPVSPPATAPATPPATPKPAATTVAPAPVVKTAPTAAATSAPAPAATPAAAVAVAPAVIQAVAVESERRPAPADLRAEEAEVVPADAPSAQESAALDEDDPDLPPPPARSAVAADFAAQPRVGWRREDDAGRPGMVAEVVADRAAPAEAEVVEAEPAAGGPAPRGSAAGGRVTGTGDLSRVEDLLEQVLAELRRRDELAAGDFSASKLMAGITQVLALAALFYSYLNKDSPQWLEPTLLVALTLQTLTISLLIMGRQR